MSRKRNLRRKMGKIVATCLLTIVLVIALFPIAWLIMTSFKYEVDYYAMPPRWVWEPTLYQWKQSFFSHVSYGFPRAMLNTIINSVGAALLSLLLGLPAAYAIARFRLGGRSKDIAFWMLSTRMFIPITIILPLYVMMRFLGLIDTYWVLPLLYCSINIPVVIWLMRGFFMGMPRELEEAAVIDGCSQFGAFVRIAVPLALPGIVASFLLCVIFSWNEFFYALIFVTSDEVRTAPVVLACSLPSIFRQTVWGELAAKSVSLIAPVVVIALFLQKHLVRGLTFGAVK